MAAPLVGDDVDLKRVARYLRLYPQCSYEYTWPSPSPRLTVFTDSDWGAAPRRAGAPVEVVPYGEGISWRTGPARNMPLLCPAVKQRLTPR